ncbi:MAG: hypothetical protein MI741_20260 [Rhodospirillales bacterium]|nr:hypothetical protein [Rhodospirillales bacterium]
MYVALSAREGWPDESPDACVDVLDQMMAHVIDPNKFPVPEYASIYYAPTGPIQEIAISNGWRDAYMKLAEEYDRLAVELPLFAPNQSTDGQ